MAHLYDMMIPPQLAGPPGTINSFITAPATAALNVGTSYVLPPGCWIMMPVANQILEVQTGAGTWSTVFASGTGGWIESDGTNFRITSSVGTTTYKAYRIGK